MIRLTPYLTPEQARRRRRADLAWRAFMVLALILAAAWLLTPEASATPTPEPSKPPLDCPEGKSPGWLDENGDPTSCVDDDPTPWPDPIPDHTPKIDPIPDEAPDETPDEPRDEPVDELAETGLNAGVLGVIAAVLVAGGGGLIFRNYRLTKE